MGRRNTALPSVPIPYPSLRESDPRTLRPPKSQDFLSRGRSRSRFARWCIRAGSDGRPQRAGRHDVGIRLQPHLPRATTRLPLKLKKCHFVERAPDRRWRNPLGACCRNKMEGLGDVNVRPAQIPEREGRVDHGVEIGCRVSIR